jgi:putative flippase GtrA
MSGKTSSRGLQLVPGCLRRQRLVKFAMVGGIGVVVQIAVLKALAAFGCHYLWATGLAVEAAVLHNFMWHQRFTWSDRCATRLPETGVRLLRFHLSNGVVSIFGSLLLTRWFVGQFHLNVVAANLLAVAACSVANFCVSDRLVFLSPGSVGDGRGRPSLRLSNHEDEAGCGRSPISRRVRCAKGT